MVLFYKFNILVAFYVNWVYNSLVRSNNYRYEGGYFMSNTVSTREEMKVLIQEEIIGEIKKELEEEFPRIRFWLPEERIDDDEILNTYHNIYNIHVTQPTFKPGNKKPVSAVMIGKNSKPTGYSIIHKIYLGLEQDTVSYFRIWGHKASDIIHNYLVNTGDYHLKYVRFDIIPIDKKMENFFIPNLPLENIHFYYPFGSNKIKKVDINAYLDEQISAASEESKQADLETATAFRSMLEANQKKPSP